MKDQKPAAGPEVHHYFQAAQRLGISVQHLMHLERTGVIEPPASLEAGTGRFYTQAELDSVAERLSIESSVRAPTGARTWWMLGALVFLIVVILAFGRSAPPPDIAASEGKPAAAARKARKPAVRPAREDGDGMEDSTEFADDGSAEPRTPRHPPRVPRTREQEEEQRAVIEESLEKVREQQAKGIYY